jgi:hypothetical protein
MNRYLITNPQFAGAAELVYLDGLLRIIDISGTDMIPETIRRFKASVPVQEEYLQKQFGADTTIVAVDFQVTFVMFWESYSKYAGNRATVKINKKRAESTWNRLSKTKQVKAWAGIAAYDKYLKKESWRNKADPDTYLSTEKWEDEF